MWESFGAHQDRPSTNYVLTTPVAMEIMSLDLGHLLMIQGDPVPAALREWCRVIVINIIVTPQHPEIAS